MAIHVLPPRARSVSANRSNSKAQFDIIATESTVAFKARCSLDGASRVGLASTKNARCQIMPSKLLRWVADSIFGYDFFILYSHADAGNYPRQSKDRLEEVGFKVF